MLHQEYFRLRRAEGPLNRGLALDFSEDRSIGPIRWALNDYERIMGVEHTSTLEVCTFIQERMDQGDLHSAFRKDRVSISNWSRRGDGIHEDRKSTRLN